jgi:hypothetical protein
LKRKAERSKQKANQALIKQSRTLQLCDISTLQQFG